jgi:hypothetical protein
MCIDGEEELIFSLIKLPVPFLNRNECKDVRHGNRHNGKLMTTVKTNAIKVRVEIKPGGRYIKILPPNGRS